MRFAGAYRHRRRRRLGQNSDLSFDFSRGPDNSHRYSFDHWTNSLIYGFRPWPIGYKFGSKLKSSFSY
ncbi:hypothetical protein [uncultured Duncaniella sp.]|uniref:hypothetical protein n=1 Tax=uncultured Duncaniella sp. TaxID=2768039 RepID=UPI0027304395|nr:hypothetical protein [uncultured Duncaniella sp.]